MAISAPKKKNNKKTPQTSFVSNNVEPSGGNDYEIAWKLEYDKLSEGEKKVIDNAKVDSLHGVYGRNFFVDAFIKRVVELAEPPEKK